MCDLSDGFMWLQRVHIYQVANLGTNGVRGGFMFKWGWTHDQSNLLKKMYIYTCEKKIIY